jgi:hypothetical protein
MENKPELWERGALEALLNEFDERRTFDDFMRNHGNFRPDYRDQDEYWRMSIDRILGRRQQHIDDLRHRAALACAHADLLASETRAS